MTGSVLLLGLAWVASLGPPVLPQLPARGVRPPPASDAGPAPAAPADRAPPPPVASVEPSVEPAAAPEVVALATTTNPTKPPIQPATQPTGHDGVQPLTAATEADHAAWASDDLRAAAPLSQTTAGVEPRAGGDTRVRVGDADSYGPSVVVRTAAPEPGLHFRRSPGPPLRTSILLVAYRNFNLVDALGRRQSWHVGSVEITPCRRYFRLNLLTEAGVEGGEAARAHDRADLMVMQKLGLGAQYPHWVTPFIEAQGGVGVTRMEVFERNHLAFTWSVGIDAGAQWAVTRWLFMHAAIGWLHPVLRAEVGPIHFDRVAFKLGLGF